MNSLTTIIRLSSIACLKELTERQLNALAELNITRLSDLLTYRPIINARSLMALVRGECVLDLKTSGLLDQRFADRNLHEIPFLRTEALFGIGPRDHKVLREEFKINTIEELAGFKPFVSAERLVFQKSNEFFEAASAPDELMPTIVGNVQSSVNFSSFIREKTLKFKGLELVYDDQRQHVDSRLTALFPVQGISPIFGFYGKVANLAPVKPPVPEVHLGYITKMSQKWINVGTHLGEVIHSLPLAPGESRNIAVIDWKRKQATQRTEDTTAGEQLTNELFHKRALDEVTRSTANEHQFGGTDIAAGTLATAGAGVVGAAVAGGVAGSLPGAAIGAIVGGVAGAIAIPGLGEIPGIPAGALAGAVVGFGVGASAAGGAALLGAANAQLGTVHSDSSGDRRIVGDLSQNIAEITVQKASSVRSLWSTVVVTDEQAENERLSTRNVTNYNHSHALTIQYYEVLQHYKSEISLTAAEPILFLPFRPLEFTIDLIADYWDLLSHGIRNLKLRKEFDAVINGLELQEELGSPKIEYLLVQVVRFGPGALPAGFGFSNFQVNLSGISGQKTAFNNMAQFVFDEPQDADLLQGVQLINLLPGEPAKVFVRAGLVNDQNTRDIVTRQSEVLSAGSARVLTYEFSLSAGDGLTDDVLQRKADEIERYFNSRRYFFTRLLLLSIEKEQMIDLVESLMLRNSVQIKLPGMKPTFPTIPGFSAIPFASRDRTLPQAIFESSRLHVGRELARLLHGDTESRLNADEKKAALSQLVDEIGGAVEIADPKDPADANQKKNTLDRVKAQVDKKLAALPTLAAKTKDDIQEKIKAVLEAAFVATGKVSFGDSVHLSEFVDTTPLAITGNTLIFKMKKVVDPEVLKNNLVVKNAEVGAVKNYPEDISGFVSKAVAEVEERKKYSRSADVFLPTSGVFAEAILGRSNASEKIDITRYFNWQDSPIPHLAPGINALTAGSRQSEPISTTPTVPGNVLNIVNPPAFPDPTGLSSVLSAIQNGNIFRDMSKADQLATVMSNLSTLAQTMANQAGTLAGTAQSEALKAAADIGKAVAQLAAKSGQTGAVPVTPTEKGAAANVLEQLKQEPNPLPDLNEDTKRVIGVPAPPVRTLTRRAQDVLLTFSIEDVNEFPLSIRNLPGVSGNVRLIGSKVGDRLFPLEGNQELFALRLSNVDLDDSPIRLSLNLLDDEDNLVFSGSSQIPNPVSSDVFHFRALMKFVTQEVEDTESETIQKEVTKSFSGKISPSLTTSLTPSIKVSAKGTVAGVEVGGEVGEEGTTGGVSGEIGGEDSETETNETGSSRVTKFTIRVPTGKLEIRPL